jgi:sporulation protein YlmC with PRC-barrel domain
MANLLSDRAAASADTAHGARRAPVQAPRSLVVSSEALVGETVVNAQGESLGQVERVMIDATQGRVAYAILGRGGVFGIGVRLHPVPWACLSLDAKRRCLVLDIDPGRLDAAPAFDAQQWPSLAEPELAARLLAFYAPSR